jgi:hypothetical protein
MGTLDLVLSITLSRRLTTKWASTAVKEMDLPHIYIGVCYRSYLMSDTQERANLEHVKGFREL